MEFWQDQPDLLIRLKEVQETMLEKIPNEGRLPAIARQQASNEGKMLRPALMLFAAGLDTRPREADHLAAALEYFHLASLVHDDIVDQADERRGELTVATQYGISLALYTGDYLIWLAVKCLSEVDPGLVPDKLMDLMSPLLEAETEQLQTRYSTVITEEEYMRRIEAKTGLLFSYGAAAGYALRSLNRTELEAIKQAGQDLGVAFQLRDDLEDLLDPSHPDLKEGSYTYPVLQAMTKDESIRSLLEKARETHDPLLYDQIVERTLAAGGIEGTEKTIRIHLEAAEIVFKELLGADEWHLYQWMTGKLYGGPDGNQNPREDQLKP